MMASGNTGLIQPYTVCLKHKMIQKKKWKS